MKLWIVALVGAVALGNAAAVEVTSLYTAEVLLDNERRDPQSAAYAEALDKVLLRVSGPALVNDRVLMESLFPEPAAYVLQFGPGEDDTLIVSFDGAAIERTLRSSGQTFWGGDRPLTLVWLAVDWGGGEREIIGAEDPDNRRDVERSLDRNRQMRERVLEIAELRGLPVVFPLLDSEDMRLVEFSDIWGGFDDRVLAASERYDVSSVLIGRIRANGAEPNRWTYLFGDERTDWTGEPEFVLAEVSDQMASRFAIQGSEPLRAVDLGVAGITSADAYGRVQSLLADVNVIDSFAITEVAGDRVTYRVMAHGGATRLASALRFAGLIEQERIDMSDFGIEDAGLDALEFYLSP